MAARNGPQKKGARLSSMAALGVMAAAGYGARTWCAPTQSPGAARRSAPFLNGSPRPAGYRLLDGRVARESGDAVASDLPPLSEGQQYDCDEEADCVVKECPPDKGCRTSLDVRIDDIWYDLSGWRKAHPAGEHWIDYYDGRDATEVMHAFHSDKARMMFQKLPKSKNPEALDAQAAPVTSVQKNFRSLRAQLEKDGWWNRDIGHEIRVLTVWATVMGAGVYCANQAPALYQGVGLVLLALANTQAGWLAHDYIHGIDKFADNLRFMGPLVGGMSPIWWSDKHNKHHALTNEIGVDEDIATDPVLYVRAPNEQSDSWFRKIQHFALPAPFSTLFLIWRFDSIKVLISELRKKKPRKSAKAELFFIALHWAIVCSIMPAKIVIGHILLSGLITAIITTATHQSEEMFEDFNPDFVDNQFRSTRDAQTTNPFSTWCWGGMQYQLEHHLFPSMPRSKYPKLQPIMAKFAEENNIPGGLRITNEFKLLALNWRTYRDAAKADVNPKAMPTRGRNHHVTAIPA